MTVFALGALLSTSVFSSIVFATEEMSTEDPNGISLSSSVVSPSFTMGLHFYDEIFERSNVSHGSAVYLPEGWKVQLKKCDSAGLNCNTISETYDSSNLERDIGGLYTFDVPSEVGKYTLTLRDELDSYVDLQAFEVKESMFFVLSDHAVAPAQTVYIDFYDAHGELMDMENFWGITSGKYILEVFTGLGSNTTVHFAGDGVDLDGDSVPSLTKVSTGHYSFVAPAAEDDYYVGLSYGVAPSLGTSRGIDSDSFDVVAGIALPDGYSEDGTEGESTDGDLPDVLDPNSDVGDDTDYVCDPGETGPQCEVAACIAEGESLGAVIPDNTSQCCAGLTVQLPEDGLVGTRGTCVAEEVSNDFDPIKDCVYKVNEATGLNQCYVVGTGFVDENGNPDSDTTTPAEAAELSLATIVREALPAFSFMRFDVSGLDKDFDYAAYDYDEDKDGLISDEKVVCSDLEGHWGKDLISALIDKNMYPFNDESDELTCRPGEELNKKTLMAWLIFVFHNSLAETALDYEVVDGNNPYGDLDNDDAFASYVIAATQAGIVSGEAGCAEKNDPENCKFNGDGIVKRSEFLVMLFKSTYLFTNTDKEIEALKTEHPDKDPIVLFEDVSDDSDWFYGYLYYASANDIIAGMLREDGKYDASMDSGLTFAQGAKIISLAYDLLHPRNIVLEAK